MDRLRSYTIPALAAMAFFAVSCGGKGTGEGDGTGTGGKKLVETGELAAVYSKSFPLERYGGRWREMRIIGLLDHGTIVAEGDSIIQLDPSEIRKNIVDEETSLETQMANLEKLTVNQRNNINTLESNIKSEEASFDLKKIELEASKFESERYKRIKNLEFEQAKITMAQQRKKLELARVIDENDLIIQNITIRQIEGRIEEGYSTLEKLTIRTPVSGVFQIGDNWRTRMMIKVGDDIYPGNPMGYVPELKNMKVNTFINETDFLKIRIGQKVAVRLDAMPKVVFDGEISYIGKLCRRRDIFNPQSRDKGFDVEVRILEPDQRLKPGMTVSCEFL